MKLWSKDQKLDDFFERFTIGEDPVLDLKLAYFDVIGSLAHVKMLGKNGLLDKSETSELVEGLLMIREEIEKGQFTIREKVEDCHSEIELRLTEKLGALGKKVHSGRSRNDQVLTALKLFIKKELIEITEEVEQLFNVFIAKGKQYEKVLMPGYTHMQVAMPSSFGLWFGAYAESLTDDLIHLNASYKIVDKNPLGSAAGFGSSFPLDRKMTTKDLGFSGMNVNSVYAQMTRGKTEKIVAGSLALIAATLSKYAMDVVLYAGQNFSFLRLDDRFITGSSIMPHKKNPDGFELVRAKCNLLQSLPNEMTLLQNNLPSGYHRDFQVLKKHFLTAFQDLKDCLYLTRMMTKSMKVNSAIINHEEYDMLFTVEEVNKKVKEGIPFRDAYLQVAEMIDRGDYVPDRDIKHTHIGSIGNPGWEIIERDFYEIVSKMT